MDGSLALDGFVLTALATRGPATGRGVARAVGGRGRVYPSLRRLERDGLVTSRRLSFSTRRQRLYRLTSSGAEALAAWRLGARASAP